MNLSKQELDVLQRMFEDYRILARDTPEDMSWIKARDALAREAALAYLTDGRRREHIFLALQLRELGENRTQWDRVATNIETLRLGHRMLEMPRDWEGSWCWVLQTIFRAEWEAQDSIRDAYFENWGPKL